MKIREVIIDNDTWFVLKDICNILSLSRVDKVAKVIITDNIKKALCETNGGKQKVLVTNSEGIKQLLTSTRSHNITELLNILSPKFNIELDVKYVCKEASCLRVLMSVFRDYNLKIQYTENIFPYRIDLYFIDFKIAIECNEFGHSNYSKDEEEKREKIISDKLSCKFIKFNPDEKNFNIGDIIYLIQSLMK